MKMLQPRVAVANLQTAKSPPKIANPFYSSGEWIELRDRVRNEAGGRCQTPGCSRAERRMFVDHIVELQDGGASLERSNTWLQCGACHSAKSAAERARRMAIRPGGNK
jgi:5-methylcytosine-specific restriction endonuclease McrA